MKRAIFTTTLTSVLSFTIYSQSGNSCPQIKIKAPEGVYEINEKFKVSASFENEKSVLDSKFNWTIIKDSEVVKKYNEGIVEIETSDTKRQNRIIILAENPDKNCQNPARADVIVIPNIGSPLILDEYSELNWNDERTHLDAIAIDMQRYEDSELLVWISFDKKTFNSKAKTKLEKILNRLSMRGLKKNRVIFMISESNLNKFKYQPVPQELLTSYYFDEYIIIKGEDLEKLSVLF